MLQLSSARVAFGRSIRARQLRCRRGVLIDRNIQALRIPSDSTILCAESVAKSTFELSLRDQRRSSYNVNFEPHLFAVIYLTTILSKRENFEVFPIGDCVSYSQSFLGDP